MARNSMKWMILALSIAALGAFGCGDSKDDNPGGTGGTGGTEEITGGTGGNEEPGKECTADEMQAASTCLAMECGTAALGYSTCVSDNCAGSTDPSCASDNCSAELDEVMSCVTDSCAEHAGCLPF